jgi:hypothetical protein
MNSAKPPRLAAWILQEFGSELNHEALAGDLNEAFQQGRSKGWYWRQVVAAVRWRRLIRPLLVSAAMAWWMTSFIDGPAPNVVSRPIDMALITAAYFVSLLAPGIMRRRLRVLLALLIAAIIGLLYRYDPDVAHHYGMFSWLVAINFMFYRERPARGSYRLTIRELMFGDPNAERQRLLEKLHLTMLRKLTRRCAGHMLSRLPLCKDISRQTPKRRSPVAVIH